MAEHEEGDGHRQHGARAEGGPDGPGVAGHERVEAECGKAGEPRVDQQRHVVDATEAREQRHVQRQEVHQGRAERHAGTGQGEQGERDAEPPVAVEQPGDGQRQRHDPGIEGGLGVVRRREAVVAVDRVAEEVGDEEGPGEGGGDPGPEQGRHGLLLAGKLPHVLEGPEDLDRGQAKPEEEGAAGRRPAPGKLRPHGGGVRPQRPQHAGPGRGHRPGSGGQPDVGRHLRLAGESAEGEGHARNRGAPSDRAAARDLDAPEGHGQPHGGAQDGVIG